ncbi:MAG: DUF3179 domain-containing protein [Gammaproteobacteria bacterium]|nr:DUF3179 domain-containing protein [Gammaproteobacteria bacterium]
MTTPTTSLLTRRLFRSSLARPAFYALALTIIAPMAWRAYERTLPDNGFDVAGASVPASAIVGGGPGRDDIPALTDPKKLPASQASYPDSQRVLAIAAGNAAVAYPINILNWHEVVNDRVGAIPILVSWCPLCQTGLIFRRPLHGAAGRPLEFGVSGLLYQDNLLMYDRQTDSLWSQLQARAISGPLKGREMQPLPAAHTTWGAWRTRHPDTLVLSTDTGYDRDYAADPYAGYRLQRWRTADQSGLARQDLVIGVRIGDQARAYPFSELARDHAQGQIQDRFGHQRLVIHFNALTGSYRIEAADPVAVMSTLAYWFAWRSFYPHTQVWRAPPRGGRPPASGRRHR